MGVRRAIGQDHPRFQRAEVTEAVDGRRYWQSQAVREFPTGPSRDAFSGKTKKPGRRRFLRGIANELAADGIKILESTLCLSEIIPAQGCLTKRSPTRQEWDDINLGFHTAKEIGRLGIGQTVVVKNKVSWRLKPWKEPMRRSARRKISEIRLCGGQSQQAAAGHAFRCACRWHRYRQ